MLRYVMNERKLHSSKIQIEHAPWAAALPFFQYIFREISKISHVLPLSRLGAMNRFQVRNLHETYQLSISGVLFLRSHHR